MALEQLLEDYPIRVEIPVRWGEMDAYGHVNNTAYFRYFEEVRIAFLKHVGFYDGKGIGPILARTSCAFRAPLTYPDIVTAVTRITDLADDRFTMEYRVVSHTQQIVAAIGEGRVVSFDYVEGAKAPLPREVHSAIADVMSRV